MYAVFTCIHAAVYLYWLSTILRVPFHGPLRNRRAVCRPRFRCQQRVQGSQRSQGALPARLRRQRPRGLLSRQRPRQHLPARLRLRPRTWARAEEPCQRAPFGPPGPRLWPREDRALRLGWRLLRQRNRTGSSRRAYRSRGSGRQWSRPLKLLQVPVVGYLASLRPSVPAECPPNGPLSGGIGKPPKAKAKEAAAKAEAKAAVASAPELSLCSSLDKGSLGAATPAEWRWSALGLVLKRR